MSRPALFLDRDGVINVDHGYVHQPQNVEFIEGIFELVAAANRAGFWVVIVTNQAGIGRGYYNEADFYCLMEWMKSRFLDHHAVIDAVYFCPYHPEHGIGDYKKESHWRKPAPGMLLQAKSDLDIDMTKSLMVGDQPSDMIAGFNAGVGTLLYFGNTDKAHLGSPISHLSQAMPLFNIY